jgi:hyaluronan synthase/N-acetylglucosaminyltransferase
VKKKKATAQYTSHPLTIIVPFYNEEISVLRKAVRSILNAQGNKQVIVVDDGSPDKSCAHMLDEEFKDEIVFLRYEENKGKRYAQYYGLNCATGDFIITVDSDTVVAPYALVNLVKPLIADKTVGATTGNVYVLNQKDNFLTKMIAARYWNAFNVERKSLSSTGTVTCCSGVLSAYRTDLFRHLMPQYISQRFLGAECTYGDDRHLTNLTLLHRYKVLYVEDAICYTEAPKTFKKFFKQQLRWKKSFLRESLISLKFAFRHSFILPFEVLLNLFIPFWSLAIRIGLILSMIIDPIMIAWFSASVVLMAVIRNFFLFAERRELSFYSIAYAFVHELVLFWMYFIALFKLRDKAWGTR